MTIHSAAEFVRLRTSEVAADYHRAATEPAPIEVWMDVIDSRPDMRFWVAHNKAVPVAVLERLASDDDPRVRAMVARRRAAGATLLADLAHDLDDGVRAEVARNPRSPRSALLELAADPVQVVAEAARGRLDGRISDSGPVRMVPTTSE